VKVLVTGSDGFIGKNLAVRLGESADFEVATFSRSSRAEDLPKIVAGIDAVVHLAGINRPLSPEEFIVGNPGLTRTLCEALAQSGNPVPVIFSSSMQTSAENPYAASKREAEQVLRRYAAETGARVYVYRLPNVFGKWCRPQYNSVVATFCHHIARGLPITIHDPASLLTLVYVDDVVDEFIRVLKDRPQAGPDTFCAVPTEYRTTVGDLARQIESFRDSRSTLITDRVGSGLTRALYATYVSYLPPERFSYPLTQHPDPRGTFVEVLKTIDSGQFSVFSARPGATRGSHYHHTKTEKFLVVKGKARFGFRNLLTNETHQILTSGELPEVVETIPGWVHDITNVGEDEMVVMLWANEIFDRSRPDTIRANV
jgi:UDP-2-acetamido-2,6-beta-L-arabino-hexul-4-ose reductase